MFGRLRVKSQAALSYIKDGQGNIVAIVDFLEMVVAKYEYDSMGRTTVRTNTGLFDTSEDSVGNMNPFRWKSCYYDAESGLYNVNGRYYEADRGGYIDAMEADSIEGSAYELLGLDRNGIGCLTLLLLKGNEANIKTGIELYADPLYDPEAGVTWVDKHGPKLFLSGLSILLGIVMVATGNVGGVTLIVSGALGIASAALSEQLAGAAGMAVTGIQTIALGLKSLSCCTPYGIVAMVIGAGCVAFATAEAQEGLGYGNWMKDAGMSDEWYSGLMVATNVAAIAVNIADPKQCFKEGTLVSCLNERGEEVRMPIESIAVGTLVLAYDEETGEQAYKPVVRLFRNKTKEWYHIFADGEEIVCTGGHPFYVVGKGFIEARKLKVSEKLLLSSRKEVIIEKVEVETLTEAETTYNFEVADFHTYYVSDSKVLVHNKCVAEDGAYEARVNTGNEHGRPHAHILKEGRRMAKIDVDGNITGGTLDKGGKRFISKYWSDIMKGIKRFYPKK